MLQDTDFFNKLPEWSSFGDVRAHVEWEESPSPDERYTIKIEWRFRSEYVGRAQIIIEPIEDEFQLVWVNIEFVDKWQGKGLYTEYLKAWIDHGPKYGVVAMVGPPLNKRAETIYRASGFEWTERGEFRLDLTSQKALEWRAYADGAEQPKWRHAILADAGLLDDAEAL